RPNSGEAQVLTRIECRNRSTARRAAEQLLRNGVRSAMPHIPVPTIDATGAGDAFLGTLAAQLASGNDLATSSTFANAASALATTKLGAQASLPTYDEVLSLLMKQNAA